MYKGKSKEEYNMMLQVARIIKLPQTNFNVLCEDLSRDNLENVAGVLMEAKGQNT